MNQKSMIKQKYTQIDLSSTLSRYDSLKIEKIGIMLGDDRSCKDESDEEEIEKKEQIHYLLTNNL